MVEAPGEAPAGLGSSAFPEARETPGELPAAGFCDGGEVTEPGVPLVMVGDGVFTALPGIDCGELPVMAEAVVAGMAAGELDGALTGKLVWIGPVGIGEAPLIAGFAVGLAESVLEGEAACGELVVMGLVAAGCVMTALGLEDDGEEVAGEFVCGVAGETGVAVGLVARVVIAGVAVDVVAGVAGVVAGVAPGVPNTGHLPQVI